jgi:hypothetical protein
MREWARRQMRVCPECGRRYIAPWKGKLGIGFQWHKSGRKRPDICWRCERAQTAPADEPASFTRLERTWGKEKKIAPWVLIDRRNGQRFLYHSAAEAVAFAAKIQAADENHSPAAGLERPAEPTAEKPRGRQRKKK